jgi:chemotaxis protein histidine kinase CheA
VRAPPTRRHVDRPYPACRAIRPDFASGASGRGERREQALAPRRRPPRAAEAAGERDEVRRLAHRLKGSARNVGAVGIADLAAALEQGGGPAALDRLEAALEPTRSRLRAVLAAS